VDGIKDTVAAFPCFLFFYCLSHILFICPIFDISSDISKINKQGCCLARKGHDNTVYDAICRTIGLGTRLFVKVPRPRDSEV